MARTAIAVWYLAAIGCGRLGFTARGGIDGAPGDAHVDALPACATVGFTAASAPTVPAGPRDLVVHDLDGDGRLDIAATEESGSLSVLLGNGDGTFRPRVDYASDVHNWSIAVGDLDGDGRPDLVVGNFDANTASVYLNAGMGAFAPKVDYATGSGPQSIAVGDLDGDGRLDVVIADYTANTVSVLIGNGDGTLGARRDFTTGPGPYSVAIADIDLDDKLDLVVADQGGCGGCNGNLVSVLRGNGDGTFAGKTDHATGSATQPWHVAIADLDANGQPDVVVVNNYGAMANAQTASVFLGDGTGGFLPRQDTQIDPYPWWVSVADFDADGKPDLIIANGMDNSLSLLRGNGDGTFRAPLDFPAANKPSAIAVGDFDGDGRPDVVTAANAGTTLDVLLLTCAF